MPHPDEPALVAYVAEHSSATALAVYDASDPAAARAALRAAAAEISQIRHPDEPDVALPNWCQVLDGDGVPVLYLDMKDEIRYAALVVRIVLAAVDRCRACTAQTRRSSSGTGTSWCCSRTSGGLVSAGTEVGRSPS